MIGYRPSTSSEQIEPQSRYNLHFEIQQIVDKKLKM